MKKILLLLALMVPKLMAEAAVIVAPVTNSGNTVSVEIPKGAVFEVVEVIAQSASIFEATIQTPEGSWNVTLGGERQPSYQHKVFGPATLVIHGASNLSTTRIQYTLTREADTTASNPIGIPDDPTGTYKVTLESSTDLKTWVAAQPGAYSGNEPRRFFRLKIEKQ